MADKTYVFVYEVRMQHLTTATALMNSTHEHFHSRVRDIWRDPCEGFNSDKVLVVVEHTNDYPYVTNQWDDFICSNPRLENDSIDE
jgi:hypothetical protein